MSKFQEFKEIASDIKQFLSTFFKYSLNVNSYLELKNISEEDINAIKQKLSMNVVKDELLDLSNFFIKKLGVDAFYYNHELFNKLKFDYNSEEFISTLNKKMWEDNFNISAKKVNVELLKIAHEKKPFSELLLENIYIKSIANNNQELFDWIVPLIDLDSSKIKDDLITLIIQKGNKIKKNTPFYNAVLSIVPLNDDTLKMIQKISFYNKKHIKNLCEFYDTPFQEFKLSLDLTPIEYAQEQLKTTEPTKEELIKYLESFSGKTFDKICFLQKNGLLNDYLLEVPVVCSEIFENKEKFKTILFEQQIYNAFLSYKNSILGSTELDKTLNFLEKYPYRLYREDIATIINKTRPHQEFYQDLYSPLEKESISTALNMHYDKDFVFSFLDLTKEFDINNPFYFENSKQSKCIEEADKIFSILFEKYPDYMNDENILLEHAKSIKSDIILSTYAKHFFKTNDNPQIKEQFTKNITLFSEHGEKGPITLNWIIEEKLIKEFLDSNPSIFTRTSFNIWVPIIIEKSKYNHNEIIERSVYSYLSNDDLFKYILHCYPLNEKTQQKLCKSVYSINNEELATELMRKGISPNDYYMEQFQLNPTSAGLILTKSKLKQNLEKDLNVSSPNEEQPKIIKRTLKV